MIHSEDSIDHVVKQWDAKIPDLDFSSLHIVSRMLRIIRIFEQDRERVLAAVGLESWSFDTLAVIRRSIDGVTTPGDLAAQTLVTFATMTTRLKSLERRGWLIRQPAARDRRVVEVSLTATGKEQFDAVIAEVLEAQRKIVSQIDPALRKGFTETLRNLLLSAEG